MAEQPPAPVSLTAQQVRVLALAADGYTCPEIGLRVLRSAEAVKTQLRSARRALGATTIAQAVAIAHRQGLFAPATSRVEREAMRRQLSTAWTPDAADRLARTAYAAYGVETGGLNVAGQPMPAYNDLAPETQAAWQAAATAVVDQAVANIGVMLRRVGAGIFICSQGSTSDPGSQG